MIMPPASGNDGVHDAVTVPHAYVGIGFMIGVVGTAWALAAKASEATTAPVTAPRRRNMGELLGEVGGLPGLCRPPAGASVPIRSQPGITGGAARSLPAMASSPRTL